MAVMFTLILQTAIAQGNLTHTEGSRPPVSREMFSLVNIINMIDELAIFADEVKKVAQEVGMEGKLDAEAGVVNVRGIRREIR
jgi:osomolarity two-component system sensor histidine kinase NIK1